MDAARKWTDEQLHELEARFEDTYKQAADEMQAKLEAALKDYARENEQRQKALDDTPEARKAYDAWKKEQVADQTWMRDMVEMLSKSAHDANKHAAAMINDEIPRMFAENANMTAYAVEKKLGYDAGFTLVNEDAVRVLMGLSYQQTGYDQLIREVTKTPDPARAHVQDLRKREVQYPADMRWNRQKFASAITQGILQGESIPDIVKRVNSIYGMNKNSARLAARTATTNAENAGRMSSFERAQALGIDMEIEWLATLDGRTRSTHRELDGQRIHTGEKFANGLRWPGDPLGYPSEVWNCFVGDTKAAPLGELQRSFRRFYDGDAVTVVTASGVNFTCTPNHPILTSKGWVAAGLLDDSYDLFIADLGDSLGRDGIEPDIKHVGTSLEAIHEFVSIPLGNRASSLGVYFHEDVLTRNVDVVTEERSLRVNPKTLGLEPIDEIGLELSDTLASSDSPEMEFVGASMTAPDSLMSSGSKPRALLGSGIRHALEHGLRTVSGRDSSSLEPDIYDTSIDAEVLGESLDALSAVVKLDHVVNVDVHPIATHVYNLQTESGAYLASSSGNGQVYIIAHNCRCRANGRVVGFDGKRGDWADERGERWTRLPKGMTYDEWKKAKAISRDESYKNEAGRVSGSWYTGRASRKLSAPLESNMAAFAADDIGFMPERPRKTDYHDYDEYQAAREAYRAERATFKERKEALIDEIAAQPGHGYETRDAAEAWAERRGVVISSDVLEQVDAKILDEIIAVNDKLMDKYPQVFELYSRFGSKYTIRIGERGEQYFMEASGGLNLHPTYFSGTSYRDVTSDVVGMYSKKSYNEFVGRELAMQVRGDGTFGTAVTHEFGHNVDDAIKWRRFYDMEGVKDPEGLRSYNSELVELTKAHTTSDYSMTNTLEAFAEGFAEMECNPSSDYAKAFAEFLGRWL